MPAQTTGWDTGRTRRSVRINDRCGWPSSILLPLSLLAPLARADLCPAPSGSPALQAEDSEVRLSFLLRAMDEDSRHLTTWSLVWGSTYAAATAGQLTARFHWFEGRRAQ